ncbi:MAG: filamentous hemagglutinin N-terminal domain-containing protein [Candidatus Symbiobacter sp.]|nr:filamentous hemagglutinin N-terminal domain-containing protein [Candidatus Symbiobacter sp.]
MHNLRNKLIAGTALTVALLGTSALDRAMAAPRGGVVINKGPSIPRGGAVVGGEATISYSTSATAKFDNEVTINQASNRAAINWQSFNVGPREGVTFRVPNNGATLNTISDYNPSLIQGTVTSNGTLYLVNKNGLVFDVGSKVSAQNFVASTSTINANDFMRGGKLTSAPDTAEDWDNMINNHHGFAKITLRGEIIAADHGVIGIFAKEVHNEQTGYISARLGSVTLGGTESFTIDFTGDGLMQFELNNADNLPHNRTLYLVAANSGKISTEGGEIRLIATGNGGNIRGEVYNHGTLSAKSLVRSKGTVYLTASGDHYGLVSVAGNIDTSAAEDGAGKGDINISAYFVGVEKGIYEDGHDHPDILTLDAENTKITTDILTMNGFRKIVATGNLDITVNPVGGYGYVGKNDYHAYHMYIGSDLEVGNKLSINVKNDVKDHIVGGNDSGQLYWENTYGIYATGSIHAKDVYITQHHMVNARFREDSNSIFKNFIAGDYSFTGMYFKNIVADNLININQNGYIKLNRKNVVYGNITVTGVEYGNLSANEININQGALLEASVNGLHNSSAGKAEVFNIHGGTVNAPKPINLSFTGDVSINNAPAPSIPPVSSNPVVVTPSNPKPAPVKPVAEAPAPAPAPAPVKPAPVKPVAETPAPAPSPVKPVAEAPRAAPIPAYIPPVDIKPLNVSVTPSASKPLTKVTVVTTDIAPKSVSVFGYSGVSVSTMDISTPTVTYDSTKGVYNTRFEVTYKDNETYGKSLFNLNTLNAGDIGHSATIVILPVSSNGLRLSDAN